MKEMSSRLRRQGSTALVSRRHVRARVGKPPAWLLARRQTPSPDGSTHARRKIPAPSSCLPRLRLKHPIGKVPPADFAAKLDSRRPPRPDTYRPLRLKEFAASVDQTGLPVVRKRAHSSICPSGRRASLTAEDAGFRAGQRLKR